MQRDIATVVHIGAGQIGGIHHGRQYLCRDGTGDADHRRGQPVGMGQGGAVHGAGDLAVWFGAHRAAQQGQFCRQFRQDRAKAIKTRAKRQISRAIRPDDQINRAVGQVQPATGEKSRLCRHVSSFDQP